jgi:hypothetical protein
MSNDSQMGIRVPEILHLEARRVRYDTPRVYFAGREQRQALTAVEITVETDRPFPMMAIPPVIFVGEAPIVEYGAIGRNRYLFFEPDPERLVQGASISVGFPHSPQYKVETRFRYQLAPEAVA